MSDRTMYCVICGSPIIRKGSFADMPDWLSSAVLLRQEDVKEKASATPVSNIIVIPTTNKEGPYFRINTDTLQSVAVCDTDVLNPCCLVRPLLYFPLHTECLSILDTVATSKPAGSLEIALRAVWSVLFHFFVTNSKGSMIPLTRLWLGHGYYGIGVYQGCAWEPFVNDDGVDEPQYFTADPATIPDHTTILLNNLQRIQNRTALYPVSPAPRSLMQVFPPELIHKVISQLLPFTDPPQVCTYQIPASYWKQALLAGSILPWMPKLDEAAVEQKEREAQNQGEQWDWENLARRIGGLTYKDGPAEMEKRGVQVAKGLWNRRRIWQLVEDILNTSNEDLPNISDEDLLNETD